jgi:hypothetical protein
MKLAGLICIFTGHRWTPASEAHAGVVLLRCRRCGGESVQSSETFETEDWTERYARAELSDELYIRPEDIDPRIRERRR